MSITREQQQTAIDALKAAIEQGTPLERHRAINPETGAQCSCAVIARAFGWEPIEDAGHDVYEFLNKLGFGYETIWRANDWNGDDPYYGDFAPGGFEGAIKAIELQEVTS